MSRRKQLKSTVESVPVTLSDVADVTAEVPAKKRRNVRYYFTVSNGDGSTRRTIVREFKSLRKAKQWQDECADILPSGELCAILRGRYVS